MRRAFDAYRRPLLDLTRAQTEAACRAAGIEFWSDPHNDDPRFSRSRVRSRVLPVLEEELGPGVAAALARTAEQLREDSSTLDEIAAERLPGLRDDGAVWMPRRWRPSRPACGCGCCGSRPWRPAARPPSCSVCTSWRWPTWWAHPPPDGRSSCPATSRRTARGTS